MSTQTKKPLPVRRWAVGPVRVTQVTEAPIELGLLDGLIAGATPEVVQGIDWLYPDYANAEGQLLWNIHVFVLEIDGKVVIVDTGVGNDKDVPIQPSWGHWSTDFVERLGAAGFPPESVDVVLCSHLHIDHVGWNTMLVDGRWEPTFPRAEHVFVREELEYYSGVATEEPSEQDAEIDVVLREQARLVMEQSIAPLQAAGMVRLVETGDEVVPGVHYVPTPGHTPGHHSISIDVGGHSAFITGDFIHHPVQIARPDWSSSGDYDSEASARNRREFLQSVAGSDTVVFGSHFTGSSAGTVVEDGEGFRLVAVQADVSS